MHNSRKEFTDNFLLGNMRIIAITNSGYLSIELNTNFIIDFVM